VTTANSFKPVRLATVGLGNWAGRIADLLLKRRRAGDPDVELVSVCEPNPAPHARHVAALKQAGITLVNSYAQLLSDDSIEAVWLPVPIHLHRVFTEQALAAGKAVLVEKPAAGCVQDVDAMIRAQQQTKLPVLVSFQDTYDPNVLQLKRQIVSGRIGEVKSASILGCWPRSDAYYQRTTWAGRQQFHGQWVLDSPVSNAFAHYLHLTLFLLGASEQEWVQPQSVEAELYRANDIENYDTASLRIDCGGIPVLTLLTHACRDDIGPTIRIVGDRGVLTIDLMRRVAQFSGADGAQRIHLADDARADTIHAFARYVRGLESDSALSTLVAARAQVLVMNGASQAAAIGAIPQEFLISTIDSDGDTCKSVRELESIMLSCVERGLMLHESRCAPWSLPAGRFELGNYTRFAGCPSITVHVARQAKVTKAATSAIELLRDH
jgi:predicted dehydrogenase